MSEIERESMEFDVVIVGAGPAGLAAAIRLKQINPELSVVVLEKGGEVGAHILSGAVVDPIGIDRLLPGWRDEADHPFKTPVTDDHFLVLGPAGSVKLPNILMPPLMSNHGNYIVSLGNVCRWLATHAEALGVEIYPGFAARDVLYNDQGAVIGVVTGDMGVERDGTPGPAFAPGMALLGKYVMIGEGARGSLAKQLIAKFNLSEGREPGKYGIGLKELWQVKPEHHKPGLVQHTFGWPLDMKTGGGSFLYHLEDNQVAVGFVLHLNYKNPYLSPFDEFQRFKTHPAIRGTFEGAKRISYGARAITEGGWQSVPKLSFPGGVLIGCSAGFVNVPRIKGSHNAVLSGMLAAEHAAQGDCSRPRQRRTRVLRSRMALHRHRQGSEEGPQRQAAVVALRHRHRRWAGRPRHVAEHAVRLLAFRHAEARQGGLRRRSSLPRSIRRSSIPSRTACSPSTSSRRCSCPTPTMKRTSRFICRSRTWRFRSAPSMTSMPARRPATARPASMNGWKRATTPKFVINAQNCVHCKTCDIKDPNQNINWVPPQGGEGPVYPNM